MKPKFIFHIALILSGLLFGCASMPDSKLELRRQSLSTAYQDTTRPLPERVKAFDDLIETFAGGTRIEVIDKYINYDLTGTDYTTHESPHVFVLHVSAPNGSQYHIPLRNGRVMDE